MKKLLYLLPAIIVVGVIWCNIDKSKSNDVIDEEINSIANNVDTIESDSTDSVSADWQNYCRPLWDEDIPP